MTREEIGKASPAQINDWIDEHVMTSQHAYVGNYPKWSSDMTAAWVIITRTERDLFPSRNKFLKELEMQLKTDSGLIAWPDALMFLKPIYICRAILLAVMNL